MEMGMEKALFKLKVRGLSSGLHNVDLAAPASKLDVPMFHDDVRVTGQMEIGNQVRLHLGIAADGIFICDRCAREFEKTMHTDLDLYYVPQQLANDLEEDDNVHVLDPHRDEIDFTEDVRDALLLAIPMKILHSPDCEGIEIGGEKVALDERLATLGSLYERLREEEMNSGEPGSVTQG